MDTLKIAATANGVNYLPEYLAGAAGLFTDAGLVVETTPKDPWTGVIEDLESGAADLALGGLWVPAMYAESPRELTVVCQLNHQFPMGILLRDPTPDFQLSDLVGRTLLAPGAGGTPGVRSPTEALDAGTSRSTPLVVPAEVASVAIVRWGGPITGSGRRSPR